jgi:hypothetical protein
LFLGKRTSNVSPKTVTNNGAYVLGWGLKDDPAGSVDSKTEIVADGSEQLDLDS